MDGKWLFLGLSHSPLHWLSFFLSFFLPSLSHTHAHTLSHSRFPCVVAVSICNPSSLALLITSPLATPFAPLLCILWLPLFPLLYLSFSPYPPPHWYNLSPLSFGALQWLHHHIGDTTALANEVSLSLSITLSLSLSPFPSHVHRHGHMLSSFFFSPPLSCFSPNSPSLSLPCAPKAYQERARQSLENELNGNLKHFHIKKPHKIWNKRHKNWPHSREEDSQISICTHGSLQKPRAFETVARQPPPLFSWWIALWFRGNKDTS